MADEKKKKKSKSKAESAAETEAPPSTPAPSRPTSKKAPSKKAKRTGSNVYEMFTEKQVAEFKEGFQFMDRDKDGVIGKSDIRTVADELNVRNIAESDIDSMINDAPGPINFTMLINMFGQRQQGGAADEDDVVIAAWKTFANEEGLVDLEKVKFDLSHFGERYSDQEANDFCEQVTVDENGKFSCAEICDMMCGKVGDEEEAQPAA